MSTEHSTRNNKPRKNLNLKNLFSTLRHKKPAEAGKSEVVNNSSSPPKSLPAPIAIPANVAQTGSGQLLSPHTRRSSNSSSLGEADISPSSSSGDKPLQQHLDSSSTSHASSSNLSQLGNRSFESAATSGRTQPTTLLSAAASDNGANRIAVSSASTPTSPTLSRLPTNIVRRDSSQTTASLGLPSSSSIQFSTLPSSTALSPIAGSSSSQPVTHYPPFSNHHPKNNPHPASLADNASVLTLASSTAGFRDDQEQGIGGEHDHASTRALPGSRRVSESSLNSRYSSAMLSGYGPRPASLLTQATTNTANTGKEKRTSHKDQLLAKENTNNPELTHTNDDASERDEVDIDDV